MMLKRIAWIEDDIDLIDSIVAPLRRRGFEIVEFRNMQEVLHNLDTLRDCNLILLDLIIPSGGASIETDEYLGVSLLRLLRNEYAINIPVIVLSTASSIERFTKIAEGLKVTDILVKPCLPSHLERSVLASLNAERPKRKK
jgi:CheY-like chemotaxis protein